MIDDAINNKRFLTSAELDQLSTRGIYLTKEQFDIVVSNNVVENAHSPFEVYARLNKFDQFDYRNTYGITFRDNISFGTSNKKYTQVNFGDELGKGSYGTVYLDKDNPNIVHKIFISEDPITHVRNVDSLPANYVYNTPDQLSSLEKFQAQGLIAAKDAFGKPGSSAPKFAGLILSDDGREIFGYSMEKLSGYQTFADLYNGGSNFSTLDAEKIMAAIKLEQIADGKILNPTYLNRPEGPIILGDLWNQSTGYANGGNIMVKVDGAIPNFGNIIIIDQSPPIFGYKLADSLADAQAEYNRISTAIYRLVRR